MKTQFKMPFFLQVILLDECPRFHNTNLFYGSEYQHDWQHMSPRSAVLKQRIGFQRERTGYNRHL